ncbi:MAG: NACHT domain-containing protein, partial [Candidatus Competibacteraceae bacterium]|nr:NACHT domain-containing protein [Candidatus Competibacteraceae bacterium]
MNRNEIEAQLQLLDSLAGQLPADAYQARKAELEAQLQDFANSADGSGQPQTQTTAFNNRSVTIGGEVKDSVIVTADGVIVQRVPADTADIALLQEAYYRCLAHECSRLPLGDIDPKFDKPGMDDGVRLAKVYTDLHVVNPVRHEDDDERDWGLRLARGEGQERQSVLEAISGDERCVVLIGDPGSGKTTLVNYLTFCLADPTATVSADLPESIRGLLPVRLILRNLVAYLPENAEKGSVELIWQALRDDLHEHIGQIAGDRLFQRWQTQLLGQPVLILLDGLDEVPAMGKRRTCLVRSLRDWVVGLHRQSRVIVTARPYAYADPSWQLPAFTVFALAPFNREQMNTFIASWCEAVRPITGWTRATRDEHVASLMHALAQRHDLADLASRPLLLTLMATLHSTWGKLPDDRADLLEESVKLLLWRWQQHRTVKDEQGKPLEEFGIADDLGISESTLRETLEQLAHEAHNAQGQQKKRSNDAADIHFDRLMALLAEIAPLHLNPKVLAAYLQNRAGLLISRQGNTYAFPHRLLQEYLTACHLGHIEEDLADTLITLLHKDETWWREVYLLCVGRMRTRRRLAVDLIDALVPDDVAAVRQPNKRHWRAAMLAGEALLELRLGQLPK